MIDPTHHVKINGVKYRLAEDAEGEHYLMSADPLRPPNAVTVQGDTQKFQTRPDVLRWSLTDWSGGEGQIKFDPQAPNRWRELTFVRVFKTPGTLTTGWDMRALEDTTTTLAVDGPIAALGGNLYMIDVDNPKIYKFTTATGKWDTGTTLTGPAAGAGTQIAADATNIYFHEDATDNVWKYPGSGSTATQIDSAGMANFTDALVAELGPYVYVYSPSAGEVWEIAKTGASETLVLDFGDDPSGAIAGEVGIVPMDGKLYVLANTTAGAIVRELTPTTAAGTGFGAEIARFPGITPHAIWAHAGNLFILGQWGETEFTVLYLQPGGSYGSLGRVRGDSGVFASAGVQNSDILTHYFSGNHGSSIVIYEVDSVTGGFAQIAHFSTSQFPLQGVLFQQHGFFVATNAAVSGRSYRADPDGYATQGTAISPWHDFSLADDKILSSIILSCQALPTDWTITVDYALNGDDSSWTNVITYSTTGGTGVQTAVSTDSSTIKFKTISIRIRLTYGGASDPPTSAPVVLGVDLLAQVASHVKRWDLSLDLGDDTIQSTSRRGSQKANNIITAGDSGNVVAFDDGYQDLKPGVFDSYDVIVDRYQINEQRTGEGTARVTLVEVA